MTKVNVHISRHGRKLGRRSYDLRVTGPTGRLTLSNLWKIEVARHLRDIGIACLTSGTYFDYSGEFTSSF